MRYFFMFAMLMLAGVSAGEFIEIGTGGTVDSGS